MAKRASKAFSFTSKRREHDFYDAAFQGHSAAPGSRCPYGVSDLGERCAWLAAHYDAHGARAWERARVFTEEDLNEKKDNQNWSSVNTGGPPYWRR